MLEAQYPEKKCKEPVWSPQGQAYLCELVDLHPGPHASLSLPQTVSTRDQWEQDHPDWRDGVGSMDTIV